MITNVCMLRCTLVAHPTGVGLTGPTRQATTPPTIAKSWQPTVVGTLLTQPRETSLMVGTLLTQPRETSLVLEVLTKPRIPRWWWR